MSNETIKFIRIFLVVLLAVPSLLIRWAILSRNPPSYIIGWWVVGLGGWQGFIFSAMFVDPNEMIQRGIDTNDMPGAVLMFAVISMFMILINFYALKYRGIRKGDQIIFPLKDDTQK